MDICIIVKAHTEVKKVQYLLCSACIVGVVLNFFAWPKHFGVSLPPAFSSEQIFFNFISFIKYNIVDDNADSTVTVICKVYCKCRSSALVHMKLYNFLQWFYCKTVAQTVVKAQRSSLVYAFIINCDMNFGRRVYHPWDLKKSKIFTCKAQCLTVTRHQSTATKTRLYHSEWSPTV